MYRHLGILLFVLVSFFAEAARADTERSQIDLRLFPFADAYYEINDVWDFYPGEFLSPTEVATKPAPRQLSLVAIIPRDQKLGDLRHGTFRLLLKLPNEASHYTIFLPELRSASRIWINGALVSAVGRPGSDVDSESPALRPVLYNLEGEDRTLDIVVQISAYNNYQFMSSSTPIRIGQTHRIYETFQAGRIRDAFVVGAIFIMAFYHFCLYALRRERLDPLLFGIFCFAVGIRSICRSEGLLLYELINQPDFHWQYRFEYWGISIPAASCSYFIYVLFHKSIPRKVAQSIVLVSGLYALCIAFLPLRLHGVLLIPFEIMIVIGSAYLVKCLAFTHKEQRTDSLLIAAGFGLFILTIVNDILKNHNLIKSVTLSHIGLFLFILVQAVLISKRFSQAFRRLKGAEVEIRNLNDDLERRIKDRTQTIRIILDNVKAGFLWIGPDLAVKEGFTKSCQDILGRPIKVGQKLQDLFEFSERERAHFQLAVAQAFSGLLPDDVSLSQIHSRIALDHRVLSLQGSLVRDEGSSVQAILFTIMDVSGLAKAEQEARINQTLLSIMQDKAAFQSFLGDSQRELRSAEEALVRSDDSRVRMILHTLKGNFATFGLDEIAQSIHRIEDLEVISEREIGAIDYQIKTFVENYQDLIGFDRSVDGAHGVFVATSAFDELRSAVKQSHAVDDVQHLLELWIQKNRMVPIRSLFGAMLTHTHRLATHLGKDVDIHVSGGDVPVDPEKLGPIVSNISHLLRNSVDHGIEIPEHRSSKQTRARIEITIEREPHELVIYVADDGQGLDWERIREVALEKGLMDAAAFDQATEDAKAQLIFMPGFSTAETVTDISGRGVGMSALKAAVEEMGGAIQVKSQRNRGCVFTLRIPDHEAPPHKGQAA